jgi:hypothetical protein
MAPETEHYEYEHEHTGPEPEATEHEPPTGRQATHPPDPATPARRPDQAPPAPAPLQREPGPAGPAPETAEPAQPPVPRYLEPLAQCGALEPHELRQLAAVHRVAQIEFQGETGQRHECALAHLAPDAVGVIRTRAGAGHITGTITGPNALKLAFACWLEPDPEAPAPPEVNPEIARLETALHRLEQRLTEKSPIQLMGEEFVLNAVTNALNPAAQPDPLAMMDKAVAQVLKLSGMAGKMREKLAPLASDLNPPREAVPEPEPEPTAIESALERMFAGALEWATDPANLRKLASYARGEVIRDTGPEYEPEPEPNGGDDEY